MHFKSKHLLSKYLKTDIIYAIGRVAEWPIASVLKTEVLQGTVGSNPTSSNSFYILPI